MAGVDRLSARSRPLALTGVTASVVEVFLNLAVWFGAKVVLPERGFDGLALASAISSLVLLQRFHFKIVTLTLLALISAISIIISSSSLFRSTSGEHYRRPMIQTCRRRLFSPPIQVRKHRNETDLLLSCHNNLPWQNLRWLLFGTIDCPIQRFSFRLTSFTIFTYSVNTHFHFVNSAGKCFPQRFCVDN
jgi:chromate transporter